MRKMILLSAVPGAGKSTWAENYRRLNSDERVFIVSSDEIRKELGGSYQYFKEEAKVWSLFLERTNNYAKEYEDVTERNSGGSVTTSQPVSGTDESRVSAFNSSTYEPDRQTISNAGTVKSESDSGETGKITHNAHLFGNIGVTTSAAMVKEETQMRGDLNMYSAAGAIFANELLIQIY